ncbi:hypothetical protein ACFFV7_46960 [Nonomuraea spiralis]|uniref:Uncharacterized protein n=1 Tax=Nonomuraea spiralis TaxID=46182 RepID=A0ABV5IW53_9ACTN|nr:hypothetical protein [Nonomuraea spiralis]GGS85103.1 hypothetical protein GCM10010176_031030 [Nonomuraea spiralis]
MAIWKRTLGIAGIALAFAAAAPVTTAAATTAATTAATASDWELAGYYYGPNMYEECHRDGVRTGRGYKCVYYPSSWEYPPRPHYELMILV